MALTSKAMRMRIGTAAEQAGTVLPAGVFGRATDTGKIAVGDGTTAWASLDNLAVDAT